MKFKVDNQTFNDLEIFAARKDCKSVFDIFNSTCCLGGKNKLYNYLKAPLSNHIEINKRKDAISFFQGLDKDEIIEIDKNSLDFIEHYLTQGNYPTKPPTRYYTIEKAFLNKLSPQNEYYIIERGIDYLIDLIRSVYRFSKILEEKNCPILIQEYNDKVFNLFSTDVYNAILKLKTLEKIGSYNIAKYDYTFRYTHREEVRFILDLVYEYDVFIAVARTAEKYDFSYPQVLSSDNKEIQITGLFHPFIKNPVKNDINFDTQKNILFITGPNMAGKSTFLKSLGISVLLAHAGFPVPAENMIISTLTGLYTTINIADSLNSGYSHFYSEVLRIKGVANELKHNKALVIFDELFRGTNVKDAYDGTLAVISAFTEVRNSFFAVSTHIVEAAYKLENISSIQFSHLEIVRKGNIPTYTYKLKGGITEDRLGMYILEQEDLIKTIKEINN